jgi:hypothetical protein
LVDWPKSPAAISADISFVSAGKRRGFCLLLGGNLMRFFFNAR